MKQLNSKLNDINLVETKIFMTDRQLYLLFMKQRPFD